MKFLEYFSSFTFALPLLVYFFYRKYNKTIPARVIFIYSVYTALNELLLYILTIIRFSIGHPNSFPILYALFTIFEYILLGYYIYISLQAKIIKKSLLFFSAIFIVISLINFYTILLSTKRSQLIDTIPVSTSAIILIVFSIIFFFEQIQSPKVQFIYSTPNFWIIVGIMIYFSGTFFLFLQYSDLSKSDQDNFWVINLICIILKNIFFSIAFVLTRKIEPESEERSFDYLKLN